MNRPQMMLAAAAIARMACAMPVDLAIPVLMLVVTELIQNSAQCDGALGDASHRHRGAPADTAPLCAWAGSAAMTYLKHAAEASSIVDAVRWVLRGHSAAVQGAALADLLAIWLAGHHVPGDEDATRKLRADLLTMHCSTARDLVPINAKQIGTTP